MTAAFATLHQLIVGFQASEVIYVVTKFKFADHLQNGPKSGEELAHLANTHAENTGRVMRAAACLGIFTRDHESLKYSLNDVSRMLLDGPSSLRYGVLHSCEEKTTRAWMRLDKAVETGANAFTEAFGVGSWEYLQAHPESSDNFNRAMTAFSSLFPIAQTLTSTYGFQDAKRIVDIGGGHGILTTQILRLNPHLQGTSFDLPHVIEEARAQKSVNYNDVEARFEFAAGSFFESVPSGGDVYTIKSIIHDWDDAKAIEILRNVRNAMPDHGKVIVLELILKETGDLRGSMMDLHMMVMLSAKERTEEEFKKLFDLAGLRMTRVIPLTPSFVCAIEAVKK
eukprot:Phypoly_transcript_04765.p1 GENE.Phypoly_transcript_04765~~Phypoly_transcript_04765.p1  ORF type:complete len:339 (+),score=47.37 Phypoly_transcript_04765:768-1784(+)